MTTAFSEPWRLTWGRTTSCDANDLSVLAIPIEGKDYVHNIQFPDAELSKRTMMCVNACAGFTDDELALLQNLIHSRRCTDRPVTASGHRRHVHPSTDIGVDG